MILWDTSAGGADIAVYVCVPVRRLASPPFKIAAKEKTDQHVTMWRNASSTNQFIPLRTGIEVVRRRKRDEQRKVFPQELPSGRQRPSSTCPRGLSRRSPSESRPP